MLVYIICMGVLSAQAVATKLTSPNEITRESRPTEGCKLPDFPLKVRYIVSTYSRQIVPGDVVSKFTVLAYSCKNDYEPTITYSFCQENRTWSDDPKCETPCIMPTSDSVDFACYSPVGPISCRPRLPSGTTIRPTCKNGHFGPKDLSPQVCRNGRWTGVPPHCVSGH